jgi:uncharacterized repeat protein (TIGR01451 family)
MSHESRITNHVWEILALLVAAMLALGGPPALAQTLFDTRDPAPPSDQGSWLGGERVQLTGSGWSAYQTLVLRIVAPDGKTLVFSDLVKTDANGNLPPTDSWHIPGQATVGVYRILVGYPYQGPETDPPFYQYDTFTVTGPFVSLTKTAPDRALAGGPLDYTLSLSNTSNEAAQNVVVDDPIPTEARYRVNTVTAPGFTVYYKIGGTYTTTPPTDQAQADAVTDLRFALNGNLGVGDSHTITFGVLLSATLSIGQVVTNNATLSFQDLSGNPRPSVPAAAHTTINGPLVSLTKTVDLRDSTGQPPSPARTTATVGDILIYPIEFTNTGSGGAYLLVLYDFLPPQAALKVGSVSATVPSDITNVQITYSNDGGATWTYTPVPNPLGVDPAVDAVRWTFTGRLMITAPDNRVTASLQAVVQPGVAPGTTILNTAILDYTNRIATPQPRLTAIASIPVTGPGVSLEPDHVVQSSPGATVVFAHTLTNLGVTSDTFNFSYTATQSWAVTLYRDADGDGQPDTGELLTDTNGDGLGDTGVVDGSATIPILAQVVIPSGAPVTATDILILTAQSILEDQRRDSATDRITLSSKPILKIEKYIQTPGVTRSSARPGETITYGLILTNAGQATAMGIIVTDTVPPFARYVSGSTRLEGTPVSPDPYNSATRSISVAVGDLTPSASATITFQAVVE